MSTIALKVLELAKSLPPEDQRKIAVELATHAAELEKPARGPIQRLPDGTCYNPDGIPDDDPFFKTMEEQKAACSQDPGPPPEVGGAVETLGKG